MTLQRDPDFGWWRPTHTGLHRHWTHIGAWLACRRARKGKR